MMAFVNFYMTFVNPVFLVLYGPVDWVLGWTTGLGPVYGVIAIGTFTGLGVNLYQKFFSDQKLLGRCKADLKKNKAFTAEAKKAGDKDKVTRLMNVSKRISGKYMGGSLKPALITIFPVIVVAMWTGSRLGFYPLEPNRDVRVTAFFEDEAKGFAHIVPADGLKVTSNFISPVKIWENESEAEIEERIELVEGPEWQGTWWKPWTWAKMETEKNRKERVAGLRANPPARGNEAHWTVTPLKTGDHKLVIRYSTDLGAGKFEVDLPVQGEGGRPPELDTFFNAYQTDGNDALQVVRVHLKHGMMPHWWNLKMQWMGLYLVVAVILGIGLRFAFRVN